MWFWLESVSNWTGDMVEWTPPWHCQMQTKWKNKEMFQSLIPWLLSSQTFDTQQQVQNLQKVSTELILQDFPFGLVTSVLLTVWMKALWFSTSIRWLFIMCNCSEFQSKTLFKDLASHSAAQATQANKGQAQPFFFGSFTTEIITTNYYCCCCCCYCYYKLL